jgi:uncharacterized repeat protein (TIGR03803 family)
MMNLPAFKLCVFTSRSGRATFAARLSKLTQAGFLLWCFTLATVSAQTFTSLHSFDGSDGGFPQGKLVEGRRGKFYGVTPYGGTNSTGLVFEITSRGKLTILHSFGQRAGLPFGALIRSRTGNFYGVTSGESGDFPGTVFEITPEGKLTTLYQFCSQPNCSDGEIPYAALAEGRDGNFYGTTNAGGANGKGTIFEVTPQGDLTTLYSFCSQANCADGGSPLLNGLVLGRDGNFYGTTPVGGTHGLGTVFEITPQGQLTTLYSFCSQANCTDGATPYGALVEGRNGNFYGTTYAGGVNTTGVAGTIFEITSRGELKTLHRFCSEPNCADGGGPFSELLLARNGNFYGTLSASGPGNGFGGLVFELTPRGKLTTIYSFCSQPACVDGRAPIAGLAEGRDGKLYGSTFGGGLYSGGVCGLSESQGCGTLFKITLNPCDRGESAAQTDLDAEPSAKPDFEP